MGRRTSPKVPVIPSAFSIDLGCSPHFTATYKKDFVSQSTSLDVFYKRAYRMVEGSAYVFHALGHCGVVIVRVHVPNEVSAYRDEPSTPFRQPSGKQQELP